MEKGYQRGTSFTKIKITDLNISNGQKNRRVSFTCTMYVQKHKKLNLKFLNAIHVPERISSSKN